MKKIKEMNKSYLKYLVFLLPVVAIFGCSQDFLDVKPQAAENSAAFYLTQDQGEQAVIAAYSQFNNIGVWGVDMMQRLGDIPSDDAEAGGEDITDVPSLQYYNWLTPLTTDGVLTDTWGTCYKAIYFCNIAIEKLPGILETDPNADPNIINRRIAEVKFLRAINYFYLTKIFGGVPLVDHVLGSDEFQQARANIKDIYNLIEQDLKDAIAVLPERNAQGGEFGRASKGAAKALLGRLYLFESSYAKNYAGKDSRFDGMTQRWNESLKYSEEVINSGQYELVGINGEKHNSWRGNVNGYRYIFTSDGDNSKEGVFEIQCVQEGLGWSAARGNALAQWSGARYYYNADGVSTTTGMWGFGVPTQALYDAFEPGDPRLAASMVHDGDTNKYYSATAEGFPYSFEHCITKIYPSKWEASYLEFRKAGGPWHSAPQNIRLIRISEVYLNAAEAALEAGDQGKALQYINKVRERARMCGNTGVPAALTSVTLADIQHERRVEFSSEGMRFADLVRWGIAAQVLNASPTADGTQRNYQVGKHEFEPVPEREVSLSNGKLQQYDGW